MPNDLNLELSQRVSVALAFLLLGLALTAAVLWRGYFLIPMIALLIFLLGPTGWSSPQGTDPCACGSASGLPSV